MAPIAVPGEPAVPTPLELIASVRGTHHLLDARLDAALAPERLTFAQFEVLYLLYDRPKQYAAEIGRQLDVSRQTIHRLLWSLERAGLLEMLEPGAGIRGAQFVPEGRRRLERAANLLPPVTNVLGSLPHELTRRLAADLDTVRSRLVPRPPPWWWD